MFESIDKVPKWIIAAHLFEFLVNCLSIFLSVLAAKTITKHRLFHPNLCLLINFMGLGLFILIGSRMASLIQMFLQPEGMLGTYILLIEMPFVVLEVCRVYGCSIIVTGAIIGIFERIIASVLLEKYEKKTHTFYVLLAIVGSSPTTAITTYYSLSVEYGKIMAIIAGFLGVTVFSVFISVNKWNKRRLELSIKHGINYTLNQRFQLSECIRAAALIYRSAIFGSIGSIVVVTLILMYQLVENDTQIYLLRVTFNIYVAFYNLTLVIVLVTQPTVWRLHFLRQLRRFCPFTRRNRITSLTNKNGEVVRARIQNLDGIQLEFSQDVEGQLYFQQLANSWNQ